MTSSEYFKQYHIDHREHKLALAAAWYQNNKEQAKETAYRWVRNNPEKRMLARAKYRAKQKGLEFNIDISDINIPEVCPVMGIPLVVKSGVPGPAKNSPSLDRIDNSKGYIKGNVRVISAAANTQKMTKEDYNV
jgi:hypothetical protein